MCGLTNNSKCNSFEDEMFNPDSLTDCRNCKATDVVNCICSDDSGYSSNSFDDGNVVKLKNGPETFYLWGDKPEFEYFLISSNQDEVEDGHTKVYSHPYTLQIPTDELELVADDEFEEFPDDFADGWAWWDSLEDTDDFTGPNWIEYLGR